LAFPENGIKQFSLLINFKVFFLYFKNSFMKETWIIFFDYIIYGGFGQKQKKEMEF